MRWPVFVFVSLAGASLNEEVLQRFISVVCTHSVREMPRRIPACLGEESADDLAKWADLELSEFARRSKHIVQRVHETVKHDGQRAPSLYRILGIFVRKSLSRDEILTASSKLYYYALNHLEEVQDRLGIC